MTDIENLIIDLRNGLHGGSDVRNLRDRVIATLEAVTAERKMRADRASEWSGDTRQLIDTADAWLDAHEAGMSTEDVDLVGLLTAALESVDTDREGLECDLASVTAERDALRAIIDEALAAHADGGASQGYVPDGYGVIEHCCVTCGTFGEYGEPWPCATYRTLSRAATNEEVTA